ncbi:MAG TPA: PAS domain-containing protein [Flavitalea sp.]|nr:PAS domain-containing protein [Flavitalea sp.]
MENSAVEAISHNFLLGGGEMGDLCRNHDWSKSEVGSIDEWPQSLRTSVGLVLHSAFPMLLFWGRKSMITFYNDAFRPSLGTEGKHPALGKKAQEMWSEIWPYIGPLLTQVMDTGVPVYFEDQLVPFYRNGQLEDIYWTFSYSPAFNDAGEIDGVMVICTETTNAVGNIRKLGDSEARFKMLLFEAPVATCFLAGKDRRIELVNEQLLQIWHKDNSIIGMRLEDALPWLKSQRFLGLLDSAFSSGKTYSENAARVDMEYDDVADTRYFNFTFKPIFTLNEVVSGIMVMVVDVTQEVLAQQKITKSQEELLASFNDSPVGLAILSGEHLYLKMINPFAAMLAGREADEMINKPLIEAIPEFSGLGFDDTLRNVLASRQPFTGKEFPVEVKRGDSREIIYIDYTFQPLVDSEGMMTGLLVVVIEVTSQVLAKVQMEEKESALKNAIELAELGTWTLDVASGVLTLSPRHVAMFGLESGIISSSDSLALIHESDKEMVAKAYWDALQPGSGGRYESEYTARNATTGDEIIVRALGQVYYDSQKNPLRIEGTVQDVTMQRRAQAALKKEVEKRTNELAEAIRTLNIMNKELKRSNTNLEEFAHAASHDLKEPIRKIQFFTNQLKDQLNNRLSDTESKSINRIENATLRMGNLIDDLLLYSQVSDMTLEMETIDLNSKVQAVLEDLELVIQQKSAIIHVENLPVIRGYRRQVQQMFQNLISNALKYSKTSVTPVIQIYSGDHEQDGKKYHFIEVKDNGIGFEQQYADKIFQMFTRLHGKSEYGGTGLGLSIVKKVIDNHKGFIRVDSKVDQGSAFRVFWPVYESEPGDSLNQNPN